MRQAEVYSNNVLAGDDFITFGKRIGVLPKKLNAILDTFSKVSPSIEELIVHSFLDERSKRMYRRSYQERMSRFLHTSCPLSERGKVTHEERTGGE